MPDRPELKPARVFLALWPDAAIRDRLAEVGERMHKTLHGKMTRPETIHLTLVFIGDLARDRIPGLIEALPPLDLPAFRVDFDQADCWRHNRIAFLGSGQPPEALFNLVDRLQATLDGLAIGYDHRPYKPHITLVRKAACPKGNPADGRVFDAPEWGVFRPVAWPAKRFVLVESVPIPEGIRYDVLGSFSLL